jgi:hypothetical protein
MFTRAVNALSGGGSTVLGFYYSRDLLPITGPRGLCPGSNVGEIFYLPVPDPTGIVSEFRNKDDVRYAVAGAIAHEFQHLINASRRMYINNAAVVSEERWLNEGLSHIAEELNFYAMSGFTPRINIGSDIQSVASPFYPAYKSYMLNNINRMSAYLGQHESRGPVGRNDDDDAIPMRGAIWLFLRYVADHHKESGEQAFWFALANSQSAGMVNLTAALGTDPKAAMRSWVVANAMDDRIATPPLFQHPSWVLRQFLLSNRPVLRTLADGVELSQTLWANSVAYLRFATGAGGEAYVRTTAGSDRLPPNAELQITLVRTK